MVEGKCHPSGIVVPIKACLQQQPNESNELLYLTEIYSFSGFHQMISQNKRLKTQQVIYL